ncbi:odorant receptor 4-like [Microplitis demolitor]|uniref:odorant receptor 4-like n=1 Tax=Microplitis demolitor TaxID=69319 RepID=UPI00235B6295|nr:odorant receptor 4-like [Microplitis demolitor]
MKYCDQLSKDNITKPRIIKRVLMETNLPIITNDNSNKYYAVKYIHMYYYVDDFDEQITLIAPILLIFVIFLKFMAVIYRRNTIMKCINHITADWNMINCQEEKEIMTKNLNTCNNITFSNNILKKTLFEICLVEIGASSALLCIDEFCILRMLDKNDFANMVPYFMIFLSLSLNILILCYFSELLDSQFMEIGVQSYATDWYKIPLQARRYLHLMINMSQRPQRISAGRIIDLSFLTYVQIIKTGFAYLQILRASNMQDK